MTVDLESEDNRLSARVAVFNVVLITARKIQHRGCRFSAIRAIVLFGFKHRGLQSDLCV